MIFFLNGNPRSGKDTAAKYLIQYHGFTRFAYGDTLREDVWIMNPRFTTSPEGSTACIRDFVQTNDPTHPGWELMKDNFPEVRQILQIYGKDILRDRVAPTYLMDVMHKKLLNYVMNFSYKEPRVVITDWRFQNEFDLCFLRGTAVRIERQNSQNNGHSTENQELFYHEIIKNDGFLTEFYSKLDNLVEKYINNGHFS